MISLMQHRLQAASCACVLSLTALRVPKWRQQLTRRVHPYALVVYARLKVAGRAVGSAADFCSCSQEFLRGRLLNDEFHFFLNLAGCVGGKVH